MTTYDEQSDSSHWPAHMAFLADPRLIAAMTADQQVLDSDYLNVIDASLEPISCNWHAGCDNRADSIAFCSACSAEFGSWCTNHRREVQLFWVVRCPDCGKGGIPGDVLRIESIIGTTS